MRYVLPLCIVLSVICLAAMTAADTVYYRTADGSWASTEAPVENGRLKITIGADAAPDGRAVLVINKPEWMVLDDTLPPELTGAEVNGVALPAVDTLDLGVLSAAAAEIIVAVKDDKNPIGAATASFALDDAPAAKITTDTTGLGPAQTTGRLVINLADLPAGRYSGRLTLSDMAPLVNSRTWPVEFAVMGITVSDDRQSVTLANAASGFKVTPKIADQVLLPNGAWSKLTTNAGSEFLYPREFTGVEMIADSAEAKAVLITAIAQNLDGKPIDGLCELEYELTIRPDTPALLLTTRSRNVSNADQKIGPNYGWLGCPYYHTPAGKAEWGSGGDKQRYFTIGNPGWVWLAPSGEGPGLLWASSDRFGEFMGGSILLYGRSGTFKPGESSQMDMAFAAADSPEQAKQIYDDLVQKGLIHAPDNQGG